MVANDIQDASVQTVNSSQLQVLLVDDDRLILAVLSKGLQQAGYKVWEASSGEQALEIVANKQPDIVLLDISMPGMSGIECARSLREKTTIPFIFISAYGDKEIVREAIDNGAVGYLLKPIDPAQIIPSIEAGLARAAEIAKLHHTEAKLTSALITGRETGIAIGILMERYRLSQDDAFDTLRSQARQNRRTINDVAKSLIQAHESLSLFNR